MDKMAKRKDALMVAHQKRQAGKIPYPYYTPLERSCQVICV